MEMDDGRVPDGTGLSQAEPQEGLGPTGFDHSRKESTMTIYHVFTEHEAIRINADGWQSSGSDFIAFYVVTGTGAETTFPTRLQRLLGKKPEHRRVQETKHVHYVRASHIRRIVIKYASDSDRSGEAIETPQSGSTEGESAGRQASPKASQLP